MYKSMPIPFFGWCSIQTHYRQDRGPRWSHFRGRLTEHVWQMPLWRWDFTVHGRGKSYRKLTGLPDYSIDWIVDEFDSSFNDLAIASMKYHMDYSVCVCPDGRRARFEDLIERLSERRPLVADTEEKKAALRADWDEHGLGGIMRQDPVIDAIHEDYWRRDNEFHARMQQARHDFIDVLPHLWS